MRVWSTPKNTEAVLEESPELSSAMLSPPSKLINLLVERDKKANKLSKRSLQSGGVAILPFPLANMSCLTSREVNYACLTRRCQPCSRKTSIRSVLWAYLFWGGGVLRVSGVGQATVHDQM